MVESRGDDADQENSKVLKAILKMDTKMEAIEKIAKEARSAASTTSNGLDQLKTKVNTLSRNRTNGGGGANN